MQVDWTHGLDLGSLPDVCDMRMPGLGSHKV